MDNKKITKEAHNAIAEKYYEFYKDDTSDLKYFDLFLKDCKPRILDLGCGMGHYSNYMYDKGFDIVGVDISENMINIAKRNNPNIEFIVSDICDLEIMKNCEFDGIVLAYVLQHLSKEEVLNLFCKINYIVDENCKLLMFLREGNGISEEVEPIDTRYKYIINEYSKDEIKKILFDNGWEIDLIETKEYIEDPNSLAPNTLVVIAQKKLKDALIERSLYMITFKDILSNKEVIEEYTKIDKQNKYPFNHGLQHIKNVCDLMGKLCDALKIKEEEKECLIIACALHDIGQVDGRENHGLKARNYIVKNYEDQLKGYNYYNDILNAVEHHDQKVNLQELPLFTNLVCFADKMDFSFKRLEENYKEQFGYIAYEDVISINFECDNKTFTLKIKTNEKINKEDLLMEHKFFYKVITATITISKKIGVDYCVKVNYEIISLMDIIRSNVNRLKNKMSLNIDSIFIEENNMVDTYFYGEENLHPLYSVSKLLTAIAVGIAIEKQMKVNGKNFNLETNIYDALKDKVDITNIKNIEKIRKWTLKDLLLHSTGYDKQMLSERYISDIDKNDLLNYALNYDIPHEVGNRYAYNNVEPFIISVIFSECFNINLSDFINENIFKKLDIKEYDWNNYGKYCPGATGLYLKHSDFHKLGQLLLNEGKYKGDQVIPSKWIKEMVGSQMNTPNEYKESRVFPKISVGYYTFISRDGYAFRDGKNGQYIIMNKDKNLLITILSSEEDMKNITEIFRDVL